MENPFSLKRGRVVKVFSETKDIKRFLIDAGDLGKFKPGQFNMLYVYGQGEVPISISSIRKDLIEHTVRLVGDVTEDLFNLKEGDILGLRGPFGSHFPVEKFKGFDIILVAGGLGLADIKPVAEYILSNRDDYGRVYLLIGSKNPSSLIYKGEFEKWKEKIELLITVDKPDENWKGHTGLVTRLFDLVETDPKKSVAMMCGPEIMMISASELLIERGFSPEKIFISMERHMKCAVGTCGHCQFGPYFVCKDGPVFPYSEVRYLLKVKEL